MIKGEYGNKIFVNSGIDLTDATNIRINFKAECTSLVKTENDGVSVPVVDLVVDPETTYLAYQYVEYTTVRGDISVGGNWKAWLEFDLFGKHRLGEPFYFIVDTVNC